MELIPLVSTQRAFVFEEISVVKGKGIQKGFTKEKESQMGER